MAQRGGSDGRPSYNGVQYAEVEYAQGDEEYSGDEAHGAPCTDRDAPVAHPGQT